MGLLILLVVTETLSLVVLYQHFHSTSKIKYYISVLIHIILSIWIWLLFFGVTNYKGYYDAPQHVWLMLNFNATLIAVIVPRAILAMCHFSGTLIKLRIGGHIRWLTNTGLAIMAFLITIVTIGTLHGRFNFKTESVTIKIKGLKKELEGLKIVQISDLHLAGFYHHPKVLQIAIDEVNAIEPDLIINTGDFVTFGWREFDRNDTILNKARSKYGTFAILGNHDFGTYDPDFTQADKDTNVLMLNKLITASGYKVLNDENTKISIGDAKIGFIGVITMGRYPNIIHGDLTKAISGLDSVDIKILLSHDPNHWSQAVTGKTDIDITLSGHTHGMQMGILTKRFKWSPSKYFYPHWNGLYSDGNQFQYVNRGLGVLSIPFRLGMPPEITIITLMPE